MKENPNGSSKIEALYNFADMVIEEEKDIISLVGIIVTKTIVDGKLLVKLKYSCSNLLELPTVLNMALDDSWLLIDEVRSDQDDSE